MACKRKLAPGQWWSFCGETDMGQTLPALYTECGGELILYKPDEWGVKVNFSEPRSTVRTHALAWVADTNPGGGSDRLRVYARSRGGRMIDTWIATKRLTNLRAAWMPEHLRDKCRTWATKEEAEAWAKLITESWTK